MARCMDTIIPHLMPPLVLHLITVILRERPWQLDSNGMVPGTAFFGVIFLLIHLVFQMMQRLLRQHSISALTPIILIQILTLAFITMLGANHFVIAKRQTGMVPMAEVQLMRGYLEIPPTAGSAGRTII